MPKLHLGESEPEMTNMAQQQPLELLDLRAWAPIPSTAQLIKAIPCINVQNYRGSTNLSIIYGSERNKDTRTREGMLQRT